MLCKFVLQKMWWYTSDTSWWIVRNKFFFVLICFLFYLRRLQFSLEFWCWCNFSITTIQLSQFFVQSIKFYQIVLSYRINPRIIEMKMKNSHFNFGIFFSFRLVLFSKWKSTNNNWSNFSFHWNKHQLDLSTLRT